MLELDILLNQFLQSGYQQLDVAAQKDFNRLLEYSDTMLLSLLMGQTSASDRAIVAVIQKIHASNTIPNTL
jgi:succinate dehydrogenase flavin-adding protein (antitoxin of CptAB toxin-antitoxin module)